MTEETTTIPMALYDGLMRDSRVLNALYRAGVDSWVGYEYAFEYMEEDDE